MTTAAPFASPLKNVTTIVDKTAAGPPTLANAAFPTKRPTITVSTVVYNCWIKVPSMIGKKNIRSCFQIIPSVIVFSSIVFFPKFFSSLTCKFLACLDFQAFRIFEWYNLSLSSFNISLLFMHKVYNIIFTLLSEFLYYNI